MAWPSDAPFRSGERVREAASRRSGEVSAWTRSGEAGSWSFGVLMDDDDLVWMVDASDLEREALPSDLDED